MTIITTDLPAIAPLVPGGPYLSLPLPITSPWGKSQQTDILMWGVAADQRPVPVLWKVHTAGHGGIRVHRELGALFLNGVPKACHSYGGSRLWYEEDSESAVPLFIFFNGLSNECWLINRPVRYPREALL